MSVWLGHVWAAMGGHVLTVLLADLVALVAAWTAAERRADRERRTRRPGAGIGLEVHAGACDDQCGRSGRAP